VRLDRGGPRRLAVLAALLVVAAVWAWRAADEGSDALRFIAGAGIGLIVAGVMRFGDGMLARRADSSVRTRLSGIAMFAGPVLGVAAAGVLARAGVPGDVEVFAAGAFGGVIAGVGVLYPIE
jgi:hypothetical protein